ncbi:citrate synthase-like protein, putative [Plasmodium sp. gorilla clade G2]|uniref:citrate synthase-like protein, putative n=1 Tax=Plasmodium sp. gorilla clade G2 TaxID=880535 RepID=UPI000D2207DD|nr:citrate synthase-like protein, putative [Plasmodium sp. gorilla clade G2]SOV12465.1 citrate synthase-like protein, putative [Plasmodium sp. gorilla clade G2]
MINFNSKVCKLILMRHRIVPLFHFLKKDFLKNDIKCFCYNSKNKKYEKIKKEKKHTDVTSSLFLETEIFFEHKDIFYRGINIRDLCTYGNFEETIYLFLYKKLPNIKELEEKRNIFMNSLKLLDEKRIFEMHNNVSNGNLLELLRIYFIHSSQDKNKKGFIDINTCYYEILASYLKLINPKYSLENYKNVNIDHKIYTNDFFCSCLFLNCCLKLNYIKKNIQEKNDKSNMDNIYKNHHINNSIQSNEAICKDPSVNYDIYSIKLISSVLIILCDNNINESTFLIRMISNMCKNYFNICISMITFYIDIFKEINLHTSLQYFLNFKIYENENENENKNIIYDDDIPQNYLNFFFHKNNNFNKKNNILKKYIEDYCNLTSQHNINILYNFIDVENYFLKHKNLYPTLYYYTLLVFHILNIPLDYYPSFYFISRLLSFTAHINEQKENNKIVKYAGVYVGNPTRKYVDIQKR